MRVQDVMSSKVQTIGPDRPADVAWTMMKTQGIHHLVVVDGSRIAGVISDRDLGGRGGASIRKNHVVADLMTESVVTVPPDAPVRKAANLMRGRSLGCLVVTHGPRIKGIVTVSDLLELIGRGVERPPRITERPIINHRAPHRARSRSTGVW